MQTMTDSSKPAASAQLAPPDPETDRRYAEEIAAIAWMLDEVRAGRALPVVEAEAVTHSLFVSMRINGAVSLRLRPLHDMLEYGSVHALNVSMLSMALAEELGFAQASVRDIGLAALLADFGLTRLTIDLRSRSDDLQPRERDLVKTHPIEGARLIIEANASLALAAVVAFEHHLRVDGTGYPELRYPRSPHRVSRLVQVCDTYHALRSPRPFRQAWPIDVINSFLKSKSGSDFDSEMVSALVAMMAKHEN